MQKQKGSRKTGKRTGKSGVDHADEQRLEREERHLEHVEDRKFLKHAPEVSRRQLKSFMGMMEPTVRREAELKYQRLVADPKNAPLTGIPMSVAGVAPHSFKVRLRSKFSFTVGSIEPNTVETIVSLMTNSGPQQEDEPVDFSQYLGNQLPKVVNDGVTDKFAPGITAVATEADAVPASTIGYGQSLGYVGTATTFIDDGVTPTPAPGVTLEGSMGRLVAMEAEFFPNSPTLVTGGTVTLIQSVNSGTQSLNGKTADELFGLQGVTAEVLPLSNWHDDDRARMVWCPSRPQDFNWLPMDWRANGITGLPNGSFCNSSEVWGAFCLQGVKESPSTSVSFTVITYSTYEILNGSYAFSTPNVSTSAGYDLASGLGKHLPPAKTSGRGSAFSSSDQEIHAGDKGTTAGDLAVVQYMKENEGPKHALGTVAHAQEGNFGEELGNFALDILPEILGFLF
jgi:hypothetical protein